MDASIILIIIAVGAVAWAFYTGHLHGVASQVKAAALDMRAATQAHTSIRDELRVAGQKIESLFQPRGKTSPETATKVADAAQAVAAAVPPAPKDIAMLKPLTAVVQDPLKVAQRGLIDTQIARLQADRAALG